MTIGKLIEKTLDKYAITARKESVDLQNKYMWI